MRFLLAKAGYILVILLGSEVISGLSSHLFLFVINPKMLSDGQYGLAIWQLAGCGLWGGIGVLFLIRYFNKRIDTFAKTALKLLVLYCIVLLTIVIVAEYLMLGKSSAIEYMMFIVILFLASLLGAVIPFFQLPTLVIPTLAQLPFTFIITASYFYLKNRAIRK